MIKKTDDAISKFCHEVINNPLLFFSESDLKNHLFVYLISEFPKKYKTSYNKGHNSKSYYETKRIHTEYGIGGMKNSRIDLVGFSKEEVSKINHVNLQIKRGRKKDYMIPEFGVELGCEKTADFKKHFLNDLKKLNHLITQGMKKGYLIYFFRDTTLARANTKSRTKTKNKIRIKYYEVAKSEWIKFKNSAPNTCSKIIPLLFQIKILRLKQFKINGKCEYYDEKANVWKRLNLIKVETTVKTIL